MFRQGTQYLRPGMKQTDIKLFCNKQHSTRVLIAYSITRITLS